MTPAYLTDAQILKLLNRGKNFMTQNRALMEREGFPKRDPLIGLTCAADVHAWIARRRQVADAPVAAIMPQKSLGENFDAF